MDNLVTCDLDLDQKNACTESFVDKNDNQSIGLK